MDFPEELKSEIKGTPSEIIEYIIHLHEKIEKLEFRVKESESRLNLNSRNSGKPPSSDGYAKKIRNKSNTRKKNPGGQPGHKGTTLKQSPKPLDSRLFITISEVLPPTHDTIVSVHQASHQPGVFFLAV